MNINEKTQWIIDKSKPFKGISNSWLLADGTVAFTDNLTFDQYNKSKGGNLELIDDAQFNELIKKYHDSLQKPWEEIDKDFYWEQYECLPPMYKTPFWFISEAYTGSLHQCYIEYNNKYYTALRCRFTPTEKLWADFQKDLKTLNN